MKRHRGAVLSKFNTEGVQSGNYGATGCESGRDQTGSGRRWAYDCIQGARARAGSQATQASLSGEQSQAGVVAGHEGRGIPKTSQFQQGQGQNRAMQAGRRTNQTTDAGLRATQKRSQGGVGVLLDRTTGVRAGRVADQVGANQGEQAAAGTERVLGRGGWRTPGDTSRWCADVDGWAGLGT